MVLQPGNLETSRSTLAFEAVVVRGEVDLVMTHFGGVIIGVE